MSRSHPETPTPLTHNDVRLLGHAVQQSSTRPVEPNEWPAFDKRIKATRAALCKVRELKRRGL